MKRGEIISLIIVLIVTVGAIFGIWFISEPPSPPKPTLEKELEKFLIASDLDLAGIYPKTRAEVFSESVNFEIFSALSRFTKEGRLVADLAEYWVNPDDLTWEIYLKPGVKFHNGSEMTAEDVKFSLIDIPQTIVNFYLKENVGMIDKVEIINPYRIKIVTKEPYPILMTDLSNIAILSKDYIEKEGYDANPIGTGPYKFLKWEKGKEIILERFEDYYRKKPIAKKVIYKIIPEEEKRIEALIKREVDFVINLSPSGIEKMEKANGIKPAITPSIGITFLGMDTREKTPGIKLEKNPLRLPQIRKAIAYGIDKKAIIEEVFRGRARIASQISVPEAFGYNPEIKVYPYNQEEAKKLLAETGYPQGFEVELLSPDDERAEVAEIISRQLSEVGIEVEVNILPRGEFFNKMSRMEASLFLLTIFDETFDTAALSKNIFHTISGKYGSLNLVSYSNPKVDELIEKAMSTLNQKARKEYAQEIMRITIEEDLPYLPLHIGELFGGVGENLEFSQRPDGKIDLADLSYSE